MSKCRHSLLIFSLRSAAELFIDLLVAETLENELFELVEVYVSVSICISLVKQFLPQCAVGEKRQVVCSMMRAEQNRMWTWPGWCTISMMEVSCFLCANSVHLQHETL